MPRYTLCPYYIDENKKSISCEDVIRRYATYKAKNKQMDKYCDKDWQSCPYAIALTEMYQRIEDGADEECEKLKHKIKAMEKEHKKLITLLGRYDVRIKLMDDEIQRLREELCKGDDKENGEEG